MFLTPVIAWTMLNGTVWMVSHLFLILILFRKHKM